ncbi:MAG: hypothetical protein REI09_06545 [Candidatus Dactylopiibacterium sp.]|nr:hypothetical protein [Candidatus Dactylopiibacterium sp.]
MIRPKALALPADVRFHRFSEGWQRFHHNVHVRTEFAAIVLALLAFASASAGLHITPVVCAVIAVVLVCGDLYDCVKGRR